MEETRVYAYNRTKIVCYINVETIFKYPDIDSSNFQMYGIYQTRLDDRHTCIINSNMMSLSVAYSFMHPEL